MWGYNYLDTQDVFGTNLVGRDDCGFGVGGGGEGASDWQQTKPGQADGMVGGLARE